MPPTTPAELASAAKRARTTPAVVSLGTMIDNYKPPIKKLRPCVPLSIYYTVSNDGTNEVAIESGGDDNSPPSSAYTGSIETKNPERVRAAPFCSLFGSRYRYTDVLRISRTCT